MNNVLNRKMFVNRNARAKLANMGGILASSPEMVDATQRFAPGGTVTTDASGATGTFSVDPQPSFLERLRQDLLRKLRNNEPFNEQDLQVIETIASQDDQFRDAVIASRDQGAAMGEFGAAGVMGAIPERMQIEPIGSDSLSQAATDQMGGDNSLAGITGTEAYRLRRGDTEAEGFIDSLMPPRGNIAPERINVNSAEFLDTSDNDRARRGPGRTAMDFSTETIPTASVDDDGPSLMEIIDQKIAPAAEGNRDKRGDEAALRAREEQYFGGADDFEYDNEVARIMGGRKYDDKKRKLAERRAREKDQAQRIADEDLAMSQLKLDSISEELVTLSPENTIEKIEFELSKNPDKAGDIVSEGTLDAAGIDTKDMTPKEKVAAQRKLLNDMMGEEPDDDKKQQFWMNMAMVGFQIASGESPDALTNISKGLLKGTEMIQGQRATEKADEKELNKLAMQRAFDKEQNDLTRQNRLDVANISAGSKTPGESPSMKLYRQTFTDAFKYQTTELGKSMEEATQAATEAATASIASLVPSSANAATTTAGAGELNTNAKRNFAAIQAGKSKFLGVDGQTYNVKQV